MKKFTFSIFMILSAGSALAQTPVDNIVSLFLRDNPALLSAEAANQAETLEFRAENAIEGPEAEFERLWDSKGVEPARWSLGVTQSIPWPGVFRQRGNLQQAMSETQRYRSLVATGELEYKIRTLLIEYITAKKDHEISHELARTYSELYHNYQKAYEKGEATIIDVNKARIESVRAAVEDHNAESQLKAYETELAAFAPDTDIAPLLADITEFPPQELLPLESYLDAYDNSAYEALARAQERQADASTRLARMSRLPGFSAGYQHAFEDNSHFNGFSVGIQLPSWNFKSAIQASEARKLELSLARRNERINGRQTIRAEHIRAENLALELAEFAPAVEQTNNVAILRRALDGGELTLLQYLQEQAYFVQAYREYNSLRRDYALVMASLSRYIR